jgi:hypothetical protein
MSQKSKEPDPSAAPDRTATLQLVIALARAYQALEQGVRPHLAQSGLGMTEFAVLEVLYHKGALPSVSSGTESLSPGRARPTWSRSLKNVG